MTAKTVNRKTDLPKALREDARGLDVPALPARKGKGRALPSAEEALIGPEMDVSDLRVAIFSGNYNYVRDGANQALNRLADYLLRRGGAVRVYSPTTKTPAFEPKGDLVSLPAIPIPGRAEYRVAMGIPPGVRRDLKRFRPNIFHVASPEVTGHRAVSLARRWDLPVI